MGAAPWLFAFLAVADFLDLCQVPAEVVAETAGQVVDAFFFDQTVCVVVGKAVGRIVFVGQGDEANGFVVFVGDGLPLASCRHLGKPRPLRSSWVVWPLPSVWVRTWPSSL